PREDADETQHHMNQRERRKPADHGTSFREERVLDGRGASGQCSSGLTGGGCAGPTLAASIAASMKFSGDTGDPLRRRSIASCPVCVMASASGPCSNRSSLVSRSDVPAARWWDRSWSI